MLMGEDELIEDKILELELTDQYRFVLVNRVWTEVKTTQGVTPVVAAKIWASPNWTVGKFKTKLCVQNTFLPPQIEFQHPDLPGQILNNAHTLAAVGVTKESNKLTLTFP
ncbi:hypothetical protein ACFE04_009911 [Oxalis oulophora]